MELDVAQPALLRPGEGEVIVDSPSRGVVILSDREELNATASRSGPRRNGAGPHVHRYHCDLFYVVEGELTILLGPDQRETALPAGSLVLAPPLVVHGFRNGSDAEVRYLNFHAPGSDFNESLRARRDGRLYTLDSEDPPADGGRPVADATIGTGEVLVDRPGFRLTLLADADEIGVCEVRSEPGGMPSPTLHVHERHSESFYVLAGTMLFTAAGRELETRTGTWVQIPAGVPHTFSLAGDGEVRFLDLHTPSCGFGDFIRAGRGEDDAAAAARSGFDQVPAA